MEIIIGTRGSRLAMAQAEMVKICLEREYPQHRFEIKPVKTEGDRELEKPLSQMGGKGIFVREIEEQLLSGDIHIAVHSMKDLPVMLPEDLMLTRAWSREDARDALILRERSGFADLPPGAVIGTGSVRRERQLAKMRPDIRVVGIRGNIDTRLRKMEQQGLDGIILAAAGLNRLGMSDRITHCFSYEEMIPAPGQGVLALEIRRDNKKLCEMLDVLSDEESDFSARAERAFLAYCGGDCHMPIGAVCEPIENGGYRLRTMYGGGKTGEMIFSDVTGKDPVKMAEQAAERMGLL